MAICAGADGGSFMKADGKVSRSRGNSRHAVLDFSPGGMKCRVKRLSLIALIWSHEVDDGAMREVDRLIKMKTDVYDARNECAHTATPFGEGGLGPTRFGRECRGSLGVRNS